MSSVNELNISGWTNTGLTTPIPRWTFQLSIKWTNNSGVQNIYGPATHTWPNDLSGTPDDYLKKLMTKVIADKARVTIGEMTWEEATNSW